MPRRYLSVAEAQSALARGRAVECFLGRCERGGEPGIKWLSLSRSADAIRLALYESADYGDKDHLDLYEFGPLDPELELDEPTVEEFFAEFADAVAAIDAKFPGATSRLVNEGLVQDEYGDYIARGRRDA